MANVTAQLQTVVSQATQVVDQSASNLAVVAAVFTQISNISSPTSPVQNNVDACICMWYVCTHMFDLFSDHHECCFSAQQYPNMATNGAKYKWLNVNETHSVSFILPPTPPHPTPSIVQIFETIATNFVQQDKFSKLDVTETQTRFLAEKVILVVYIEECIVMEFFYVNAFRFHWKLLLLLERFFQLTASCNHQQTAQTLLLLIMLLC